METDWRTLRQQIDELRRTDGGGVAAARLEYAYQIRLAIAVAAIPLALAGLAISGSGPGRRWPLLTGIAVAAAFWGLLMLEESTAKTVMDRGGSFAQYVCPWTPNVVVAIIASAILRVRLLFDSARALH